jgi:hypothetical protein
MAQPDAQASAMTEMREFMDMMGLPLGRYDDSAALLGHARDRFLTVCRNRDPDLTLRRGGFLQNPLNSADSRVMRRFQICAALARGGGST